MLIVFGLNLIELCCVGVAFCCIGLYGIAFCCIDVDLIVLNLRLLHWIVGSCLLELILLICIGLHCI